MPASSHTPAAGDRQVALPPQALILLLSMLMGLLPLSTDLYLPALPAMAEDFGVPVGQVQFTLSAMLLAFGCSQLLWGPLSDRFGRRPVLLWGLGLYLLAGVGCVLAPSLGWLVVGRLVQGAALGSAIMTVRAVVRDRYAPAEGARAMSRVMTGLGLVACLSAPLGGLLAQSLGWRAALTALVLVGSVVMAVVLLRFQESLQQRRLNALQPAELVRTWLAIGRHPRFLAFSLVASASNAGLFTYLATSSFVLIRLHGVSPMVYGLLMASMSLCYVLGTLLCRRLLHRLSLQTTLDLSAALGMGAALLLAGLHLGGVHAVWAVVLPVNLFVLAHGINQPCSQNGAVAPFPQAAGTAAALNGFCMMMSAFLAGTWLGTHMDGTATPLVQGLLFSSGLIALGSWVLVRRLVHPPDARAS